jgi:hypothetical protein
MFIAASFVTANRWKELMLIDNEWVGKYGLPIFE